ncbi:MAG: hypothetical protein PVJ27_05040 [Candidatus Brocadiaceae bacterium]|jgi:hypothetical protein
MRSGRNGASDVSKSGFGCRLGAALSALAGVFLAALRFRAGLPWPRGRYWDVCSW